ncbi:hypothetical protein [Savagea faecisuis]|uniref:Uncharacterized protein n=1 Tax=Savagea faecisuis TaxID=1274803 RepID=A0ABW3GX83_9BACL
MSKHYEEQELEHLLQSMPTVKDNRSKEDLLRRLQGDERMRGQRPKKPKNKLPLWIALAAAVILAILSPAIIANMTGKEQADHQQESESESYTSETKLKVQESNESADEANKFAMDRALIGKYALYEADLKQFVPFRLGLVSEDALSVPVSILIPKPRVSSDLKTTTPTSLQLYEQYVESIDEESYHFTSYHPYDATFEEQQDILTMRINDIESYSISSAASEIFSTTLEQTFYGYKELIMLNEEGKPAEFGQAGVITEPFALNSELNRYAYYTYSYHDRYYVAPSFGAKYSTVEQALDAMREKPNDFYDTVIPEGVTFTLEMDQSRVTVLFDEELDLSDYTLDEAYRLIEGLNLTVNNFGMELQLSNIKQGTWQKFDFRRPLPKAVSANPIRFNDIAE